MTTETTATTYTTTEAYISGGICGHLWMPNVMAGKPFRANLRGPWGIMGRFTDPASFRDAIDLLLCEQGGDFQDSRFTADTSITVIRRRIIAPGRYDLHVYERELSQIRDCSDLVADEHYTGDFIPD